MKCKLYCIIDKVDQDLKIPPTVTVEVREEEFFLLFDEYWTLQGYLFALSSSTISHKDLLNSFCQVEVLLDYAEVSVFELSIIQKVFKKNHRHLRLSEYLFKVSLKVFEKLAVVLDNPDQQPSLDQHVIEELLN